MATRRSRTVSDVFLSPDGQPMREPGAHSPSDYVLEVFENEVLAVQHEAVRLIKDGHYIPEYLWKRWRVTVHNIMKYDPEGQEREVPLRALDKVATKDFADYDEARRYYLDTVVKYCKRDDVRVVDDQIKGGGNIHEPADPNVPTVVEGMDDTLFGSW